MIAFDPARYPNRCPSCGFDRVHQGCTCVGLALKSAGQSIASAAHPDERARVDAAIRQLAATGRPFSANDCRALHGVKGGVVGAAFTAARKAGLIRACGDDLSSSEATHGHRIYKWVGVAAERAA